MPASPDWIEHRRGDRELLGWIVPAGEQFQVVDLLGRTRSETALDWLDAEALLEALGLGYLADRYELALSDGTVRQVRIGEVSTRAVMVIADEFGAASAVGADPERFELPFPAPDTLRPRR